ncbi:unnamed protein product [Urochloa humidicola]
MSLLLLLLLLLTAEAATTSAPAAEKSARYHHHHGHIRRPRAQPSPPSPPGPPPPPPAPRPPGPGPLPPCDCACNCTHCRVVPPVARGSASAAPPPRRPAFPWPGAAPWPSIGSGGFPLVSGFPGLPGAGGTGGSPTECVAPLAAVMTCGTFLTGSEPETPTPQSDCCTGLRGFLNTSTSAAAGDGDRILRCLCPVILGDVNKMLPKPIDPVRLMYLPIACGIVLPPQVLYICFTGQQTPLLAGRNPDKPSSSAGKRAMQFIY